ncbi:hypothetical protein NLG97_g2056 [Lecanicillium saksenae]|uniref:Uncharacterized protein n=1 Tax=Lecanicillium saksenae TaxID=468837 RepID=A0ACC1R3E2_9HYPO|nr:hypothetical protein NLG97_g2056 [Lecanicillium saksenae]
MEQQIGVSERSFWTWAHHADLSFVDEARPICERCRNGFHTCLGYDEARIFVNSGPGIDKRKSPASTSSGSSPAAPKPQKSPVYPIRSSPESTISLYAPTNTAVCSDTYAMQDFSAFNLMPDLRIPPTMKLDGFRDGIVISHLLLKFQAIVEGNTPGATDAPTFAGIFLAGDRESTAYISGLSVAEALFGRMHCDEELIQHSGILYGRSLKRLQSDLLNMEKEEVRARSYMNLWSSTFLGMYEMMTASTRRVGWSTLAAYLLCPSSIHRRETNMLQATAGIATKKRTFLEETKWKTVPWQKLDPLPKPVTIMLQDIFCDIPGYMEDAIRLTVPLCGDGAKRTQDLSALQTKIINAYLEVEFLRWSWEEEYPNVCWAVPVTPDLKDATGESNRLPFATVLHFSSFDRAIDAIYFNVVRLLLYELAGDVAMLTDFFLQAASLNTTPGPFSNAMLPPGQGGPVDFALEICRTVQYLVQGETDSLGSLSLMFPLRVASHHLQDQPDVVQWLHWVLSKLTAKKGFKLGEHVLKMTTMK